jgi:hypothetical protein
MRIGCRTLHEGPFTFKVVEHPSVEAKRTWWKRILATHVELQGQERENDEDTEKEKKKGKKKGKKKEKGKKEKEVA